MDRTSLQDLGEQLIADDGWESFVRRVLAPFAPVVVVDGVRHVAAVSALRSAGNLMLIFVDASMSVRAARVQARDGVTADELRESERHENEAEVDAVRSLSDLVVVNDGPRDNELHQLVEVVVSAVLERADVEFPDP